MKAPFFTLLFLRCLLHFSHAQIIGNCLGGQAQGMGKTAATSLCAFAAVNNPALLPLLKNNTCALYQEIPFRQIDLSLSALVYVKKFKGIVLSPFLAQFGNPWFKQQAFSCAFAKPLGQSLHLGVNTGFILQHTYGSPSLAKPFVQIGSVITVAQQWRLGSNLILFHPTGLTENILAQKKLGFRFGLFHAIDSSLCLALEYENNNLSQTQIKLGLGYQQSQIFEVKFGCILPNFSPSLVLCYAKKFMAFQLGFSYHTQLGSSPFSQITYNPILP